MHGHLNVNSYVSCSENINIVCYCVTLLVVPLCTNHCVTLLAVPLCTNHFVTLRALNTSLLQLVINSHFFSFTGKGETRLRFSIILDITMQFAYR